MASAHIESLEPIRLLLMRHRGAYNTIGATFGKFWQSAGPRGVSAESSIAVYLDSPREVPESDLRSDAGVIVPEALEFDLAISGDPQPGDFHFRNVPAGRYLVYRHVGPYSQLGVAWEAAFAGISQHGVEHNGEITFEWYRNDCSQVAEDELITDIFLSLAD